MGFLQRHGLVKGKIEFGGQPVADPAGAYIKHPANERDVFSHVPNFLNDVRLDAVQYAGKNRLAACQTMPKMAIVISRPMIGSASG